MELAFLLAILYGCIDVVSRMVNYQATRYLGTANGSFLNYFCGSLVCLAVLLVTGGGRQALAGALVAAGIILDKKLTSRRGAEGQESAGQ